MGVNPLNTLWMYSLSLEPNNSINLKSTRLNLRNVSLNDLNNLVLYANDLEVAKMMNGTMPYPYTETDGRQWLSKHALDSTTSLAISWAVALKETNDFIGAIQLRIIDQSKGLARLSYWIGQPYWKEGYASESGAKVIAFAFNSLKIEKVEAEHLSFNHASGRVLEKLGFQNIGTNEKKNGYNQEIEPFVQYHLEKKRYKELYESV